MKLIVDIPQDELQMYAISCNHGIGNTAMERILNGVPLEQYGALQEIRQEIIDNPLLEGLSYGSYDVGVRQKSGFTVRNEVIAIIDKHIKEIEEV